MWKDKLLVEGAGVSPGCSNAFLSHAGRAGARWAAGALLGRVVWVRLNLSLPHHNAQEHLYIKEA